MLNLVEKVAAHPKESLIIGGVVAAVEGIAIGVLAIQKEAIKKDRDDLEHKLKELINAINETDVCDESDENSKEAEVVENVKVEENNTK